MVNQFNVALLESMQCYSVRFSWLNIVAKGHGQSIQRRFVQTDVNPIELVQT